MPPSEAPDAARHGLVVGERLGPVAREALPEAALQVAGVDGLERLKTESARLDLVLIDAEAVEAPRLAEALEALGSLRGGPAVILAAASLPMVLVKGLMAVGRSDVLSPPFTSLDLARAAGALLAAEPPQAEAPAVSQSVCWAVVGSVGGCGATTTAVEIASNLARKCGTRQRAALIDLNLAGGAAAAYLGLTPRMNLAEEGLAPERIDAAMLDAFAVRGEGGPDLLAPPRNPKAWAAVPPEAVLKVLEAACHTYDWVVLDVPRFHQPWTLDVLAGADEILVVSELTVPALLAARDLAGEIESELPDKRRPRIILNRLASRLFGPAPSLAEAEKALGRKADGAITSDWEAAAACANLGGAIGSHRPRSKIVRDIDALVGRLAAARDEPARLVSEPARR
ncbi:MAG: AAA family ATPase [Caulobacteraceae bacterium]